MKTLKDYAEYFEFAFGCKDAGKEINYLLPLRTRSTDKKWYEDRPQRDGLFWRIKPRNK